MANSDNKSTVMILKKTLLSTLLIASIGLIAGCDDDDDSNHNDNGTVIDDGKDNDGKDGDGKDNDGKDGDGKDTDPTFQPINLTIAHINDAHSHLEPEGSQTFMINDSSFRSERGGYARIKTVFDDFETMYGNGNFLKLQAGDALTGTSYFSFYQGDADADMMNTICFDAFALGNHEFDEGDAGLKKFLDRLNGSTGNPNNCNTPVLAANVKPALGTPLAPSKVDDYIKPYTITTTKEGVKVGIIGIDIAGKTKNSSRPLSTTEFLEETATAQTYIDELKDQNIEHIVLLTHYTYGNDKALAEALSGVDVIIGGDSHTLLGDFTRFDANGFGSQGAYPTKLKNKDGDTVCIGQAWEYTKAVGLMEISFNKNGEVSLCQGSAVIPVAETFEMKNDQGDYVALDSADNQAVLDYLNANKNDLLNRDLILPFEQDAGAAQVLKTYSDQISTKLAQKIGTASVPLCLVRVPGTTRSKDVAGCENTDEQARGSDIAQVVAKSFLDGALRADFALQNAGGVRETVMAGDVTYDTAYTILPFGNTLINMDITGQQVHNTLEDAIANHLDENGSSGSHPYADGLRWDLDMSKAKGSRVSNIEVRDRTTGAWSPLDMNHTYVMVTNDYIGEGRDGYKTLGEIYKDKSKIEDTKLLYTQSFIDYIEKVGTLERPPRSDYSHKTVITAAGKTLTP